MNGTKPADETRASEGFRAIDPPCRRHCDLAHSARRRARTIVPAGFGRAFDKALAKLSGD
jgi:hypothetical protein